MNYFKTLSLTSAILAAPSLALAGNIANCEVVITQYIEDEDGGGAEIASFRPAGKFLASVYADEKVAHEIEGVPIRAILCRRNDIVPDEEDYPILETGIPLALSQDFDSSESDSLTIFFKDGEFVYKYASNYDMSDEMRDVLETRLADFSSRDHQLGSVAEDGNDKADQASSDEAVIPEDENSGTDSYDIDASAEIMVSEPKSDILETDDTENNP